jgi:hypothetical protein
VISRNLTDLDALQEAATRQEQMLGSNDHAKHNKPKPVEAHATHTEENQYEERGKHRHERGRGGHRGRGYQGRRGRGHYNGNGTRNPDFPCKLCGEKGHWVSACPQLDTAKEAIKTKDTKAEVNLDLATHARADHSIALDSCATRHVMKDAFMMEDLHPITPVKVTVANNETITVQQAGTVRIVNPDDPTKELTLENVLYSPEIRRNLCSTYPLIKKGYKIVISHEKTSIVKDGDEILPVQHHGELPFLKGYIEAEPNAFAFAMEENGATVMSKNYGINASAISAPKRFKLQI